MSYDEWMREVDRAISIIIGLSHDDLADQPWREWYDSGMLPREAARQALEDEGFAFEGDE